MHLLITGATGFIGKAVVEAALMAGHSVTAVVRPPHDAAALFGQNNNLSILHANTLDDIAPMADARLVHLAWDNVGKYNNPKDVTETLGKHYDFLRRMIDGGMADITVAGTCFEYGMIEGVLAEDMPCAPVTCYGLAKLTLLRMLEILQKEKNNSFSLKWLRYFYVYGLGQRPQALFSQLDAAIKRGDSNFNMSPGDQSRDFIHVETLAHNTVAIAMQETGGVFNIGNGRPKTVMSMAQGIADAAGSGIHFNAGHYPYPVYEPFSFYADTTRLKAISGAKFDHEKNM